LVIIFLAAEPTLVQVAAERHVCFYDYPQSDIRFRIRTKAFDIIPSTPECQNFFCEAGIVYCSLPELADPLVIVGRN
jgi:hypothetical protein